MGWTCEEFPCALTRDIVELCDREADLLNRGRSVESMVNLRRRLTSLFRQFVDTPEFNPEADRFLKVPGVRLMNTLPEQYIFSSSSWRWRRGGRSLAATRRPSQRTCRIAPT